MNCKQLKHTLVKLKMIRMRRCEMATWGKRLENLRENGQKQRSSVWTLRLCELPWTLKPSRSHYHRHNPQWQLPWWEWTQTLLRSSDFIHFQGNFQERSFHWLNHRHKRAPELSLESFFIHRVSRFSPGQEGPWDAGQAEITNIHYMCPNGLLWWWSKDVGGRAS